ncbi:LacI family DNA-binding transcriptional regulator [Phytohabitans kaempferiae]|uniref:LacI family DNA-binding transcriptional regulator n=1 Tax=Phytohabitans kaempferiae TaxID=1620943 RepID=A0ABV6M459_9ACTN
MARSDSEGSGATIRDVAVQAGVALSSVSRVLSGHPDVSPAMRAKVEAAVAELGYEPDLLAQSLRSGSTKTIGFVLRDISNPLFANIARAAEQELRRSGFSMLITSSDGHLDVEARNLALLRRRRVDGVIVSLVSEEAESTRAALAALQGPVVLLDREVSGLNAAAVHCDHYSGVLRATGELLARGHRRIGLVTGSLAVRSSRERLRGYEAAFAAAGVPVDRSLVSLRSFEADYAKAEVIRMFSRRSEPTALITGGIASASGALQALRQLRRAVGSDVALVTLDEWPMFDVLAPDLASVSRDSGEMGTAAARLMLDMLDGAEPRTVVIDTHFTPRDSVGSVRKSSSAPRKAAPRKAAPRKATGAGKSVRTDA